VKTQDITQGHVEYQVDVPCCTCGQLAPQTRKLSMTREDLVDCTGFDSLKNYYARTGLTLSDRIRTLIMMSSVTYIPTFAIGIRLWGVDRATDVSVVCLLPMLLLLLANLLVRRHYLWHAKLQQKMCNDRLLINYGVYDAHDIVFRWHTAAPSDPPTPPRPPAPQ
jgi:uncharacterized protein (DUF486 family)